MTDLEGSSLPVTWTPRLTRRALGQVAAGGAAASLVEANGWSSHRASAQEAATPAATPGAEALTEEQQRWLSQASRGMVNGWLRVRIQDAPFARGFQYGYLTTAEYAEAIRAYTAITYLTIGMDYSFFVEKAAVFHKDKLTPEIAEEMEG